MRNYDTQDITYLIRTLSLFPHCTWTASTSLGILIVCVGGEGIKEERTDTRRDSDSEDVVAVAVVVTAIFGSIGGRLGEGEEERGGIVIVFCCCSDRMCCWKIAASFFCSKGKSLVSGRSDTRGRKKSEIMSTQEKKNWKKKRLFYLLLSHPVYNLSLLHCLSHQILQSPSGLGISWTPPRNSLPDMVKPHTNLGKVDQCHTYHIGLASLHHTSRHSTNFYFIHSGSGLKRTSIVPTSLPLHVSSSPSPLWHILDPCQSETKGQHHSHHNSQHRPLKGLRTHHPTTTVQPSDSGCHWHKNHKETKGVVCAVFL